MPGRMLGLYALAVLDREGELHGYALADRVAERTRGSWRPGAGAIYPALDSLARKRFAKVTREGKRRVYHITPKGRAFLRAVRRRMARRFRGGPEFGFLWSEIAGEPDPERYMLSRLDAYLDLAFEHLSRGVRTPAEAENFRRGLESRIEAAASRLRQLPAATEPAIERARRAVA